MSNVPPPLVMNWAAPPVAPPVNMTLPAAFAVTVALPAVLELLNVTAP